MGTAPGGRKAFRAANMLATLTYQGGIRTKESDIQSACK